MSSDPSLIHDAHPLSPDPLAPQNVYMTNQGYPNRLSVSWRAEPHGQDGYRLLLYYSGSGILAANTSVGKGISKFTFSGLAPGQKYLLEVVSMAGPYAASAENISDWTSKWWELGVGRDAQPSPAGQAQLLQREGAGLGLGMLSGSCRYGSSSGIMVWVSQRRGEQAIQLPFGTSPSPLPFSQALRKFLAWEIWGSQAFFFFLFSGMWKLQISTISLFMCLSPQSLHFAWGIQRSLLPRSASPLRGIGSHMRSPSGRSLLQLAS